MPLRLNVGVAKKVGLPEFSSVGASCHLEVELDPGALDDLESFHERARDAYIARHQAVHDELARRRGQAATPIEVPAGAAPGPVARDDAAHRPNGTTGRAGGAPARNHGHGGRPPRPATASQVRAIVAIARRRRADLEGLLRDEYGVDRPGDLSLAQASAFIDRLGAAAAF